jgi:uracil-DNA glycosylase family 4
VRKRSEVLKDIGERLSFLSEAGAGFAPRRALKPIPKPAALPATVARKPPQPTAPERPEPSGTGALKLSFPELEAAVLACRLCPLAAGRTQAVPGEGSRATGLMFVGEGPGRDEDAQGRPFVGRAGQLLTKIIEAMHYTREEVYITNIVKCRPPENRTPLPAEVESCGPYLLRQVELVSPRAIVTLGKTATDFFVPGKMSMGERRGRFAEFRGIKVMPTYHPSYLVRNEGNRELRRQVWDDMQKVMELLGKK